MKNQNEQLNLFTEQNFEPRDVEREELKAKTNLDDAHEIEIHIVHHCAYYLAGGSCAVHGDALSCEDCDDFQSVNGDDFYEDSTIIAGEVIYRNRE